VITGIHIDTFLTYFYAEATVSPLHIWVEPVRFTLLTNFIRVT